MISSGIRLGSWDFLQWKNVEPITNDDEEIIAAKLRVYAGDEEEYYAFITAAAHGLRKFYKTRAEQIMKPINVELTMGHDIGISQSYYKPTEREILEDYLKAVQMLTINHDELTLQKRVSELTERSKEESHIIKGKLSEKEKEIDILRKQQGERDDVFATLSDQVMKLMAEVQDLFKEARIIYSLNFCAFFVSAMYQLASKISSLKQNHTKRSTI